MEWLRLFPNEGALPQTLQTFAMSPFLAVVVSAGWDAGGVRATPDYARSMAARATATDPASPPLPPLGSGRSDRWATPPPPRRPGPEAWGARLTDLPGVGRTTEERARA